MSKTYLQKDVLTAAKERVSLVFDQFEEVIVSYSGGKDSAVLLKLARDEAARRGRKIYALFIDLEAQYESTIEQVERGMLNDPVIEPIWICLPLNLRNAVSVFQPHWACWDQEQKPLWVRPMPQHDCVWNDPVKLPFWRHRMEFEEFIVEFPKWFSQGKSLASLVAIRADESLNRYRAVMRKEDGKKSAWWFEGREIRWATVLHPKFQHIVSFYPIYDWRTEDVWRFIAETGIPYARIYDMMYWAGIPLSEQRICQPYGDDQRKGLDLFAKAEPQTWRKVLDRVSGVNFGAIYAGQQMLGYRRGTGLPKGHTWKSYCFFLLSTVPDVLRERYLSNFAVFLEWWMRNGYPDIADIYQDETEALKTSSRRRLPSWRRLALAVLKNDFACKSLSIGAIKDVFEDVYKPVSEGKAAKVRKSVRPVYDYLREQYALYESGNAGDMTVVLKSVTSPRRKELLKRYEDL